jgi:hypothetical protein
MVEGDINKKRCLRCNSTQTHIRLKTLERVCQTCSFIEKLNKEDDEYDNN